MNDLELHAKNARRSLIRMIYESGDGHVGCGLSSIDILIALYFRVMDRGSGLRRQNGDRDRFILSKGHAAAAYYAVLVERGIAPENIMDGYCRDGSLVASHVSRSAAPGIEVSTGSGGHGLPIGNGMALAARIKGLRGHIYVLAGDGELAEGSMWEAIAFAGHHAFWNLTLIIDANGFQSEGRTRDIIDLEPMDEKFRAFWWDADVVDGHDIDLLSSVIEAPRDRPHAVIARTTKGKGVSFMEDRYEYHHNPPTKEQYEQAMKELA